MNVIITRKKIKNMYLRVKDNTIYVTCNKYVSELTINKFINSNIGKIEKLKENDEKKNEFKYLGKKYDVIYINDDEIELINDKLFVRDEKSLKKWLKLKEIEIFNNEIECCSLNFNHLPKFRLRIREMKTRWGVCNTTSKIVTLNSKLIRYEKNVIDYVIIHELCHFIHPNHSKSFWLEVESHMPDYKKYKKILKSD